MGQQKVQIEETDTALRTKNIHGHLALWSAVFYLFLCVMLLYNISVSLLMRGCVCVCFWWSANWANRIYRTESYGQRHGAASFLPMQPNLSRRSESCQIRRDSYRSILSPQTCQLHPRWKRLCQRRGWQSYLWALGIVAFGSGLSDLLWCLFTNASTNTSTANRHSGKSIYHIYICALSSTAAGFE